VVTGDVEYTTMDQLEPGDLISFGRMMDDDRDEDRHPVKVDQTHFR
jgi:hypothetical protein